MSAFLGLLLSYAFRGVPHILFGASALIVFLALYALAKGASKLGPLFILVCVTVVPVIGLQSLVAAEGFAVSFASGACFADVHGLGKLAGLSEGAATSRRSEGSPTAA